MNQFVLVALSPWELAKLGSSEVEELSMFDMLSWFGPKGCEQGKPVESSVRLMSGASVVHQFVRVIPRDS